MAKELIFLLTHKLNPRIIRNIRRINQEKGDRDFYVLVHGNADITPLSAPVRSFSLDQIQSQGFKMLDDRLVPGSVHLPLFYYFREFPGYENYWYLEYDVEFGGNWKTLFNSYLRSDADFISGYVQRYQKEKHWPWWFMEHPQKSIPVAERVRAFNPIFRISNQALQFLSKELKTGWLGHNEVLLSTLLYHNKFQLLDFSDGGEFSSSDYPNFYGESSGFPTKNSRFLKLGTHRYRPPMKKAGIRNLIYHPVKMETGLSRVEETSYQLSLLMKKLENRSGAFLKKFRKN